MVSVHSVIVWMLISAACAFITWQLYRKSCMILSQAIALPVLAFYVSFVLTITLTERIPSAEAQYQLSLFWSYREIFVGNTSLIEENLLNVVLFMPIGFFLPALLRQSLWISVAAGAVFSTFIEITQLITHRGLFEFDDIVHNTLGTVLGVFVFVLVKKFGHRPAAYAAGFSGLYMLVVMS